MTSTIYDRVTDAIVKAIEAGAGKWQMPWHTSGKLGRPVNLSGRSYRGSNVISLWCAEQEHDYASSIWGTYRQWQEAGAQVRKGEKATEICFWKSFTSTEKAEGDEDETERRHMIARGYSVFNRSQVDDYVEPAPKHAELSEAERIAHAEAFFAATGSVVRHGGERAFYTPGGDFIRMPPFAAFRDAVAYYGTLGHEHIHWTGPKSRLDREFGKRFGDRAYAFEELVAEIGAAFLCAELGLANEPRPDHAAYVQTWLKVLADDHKAIFTAASKAQAAVDYLDQLQHREAASEAA